MSKLLPPPKFHLSGGDFTARDRLNALLEVRNPVERRTHRMTVFFGLMFCTLNSLADIIICQSVFRRNVAMAQTQWLLHTRHEEACAGFIQEIWRAYVARERFVRVVSKIDRPKESKSATEIARAWKAFTAQRKHASIVKGECLLLPFVSLVADYLGSCTDS